VDPHGPRELTDDAKRRTTWECSRMDDSRSIRARLIADQQVQTPQVNPAADGELEQSSIKYLPPENQSLNQGRQ
jgi:hypothetical protein